MRSARLCSYEEHTAERERSPKRQNRKRTGSGIKKRDPTRALLVFAYAYARLPFFAGPGVYSTPLSSRGSEYPLLSCRHYRSFHSPTGRCSAVRCSPKPQSRRVATISRAAAEGLVKPGYGRAVNGRSLAKKAKTHKHKNCLSLGSRRNLKKSGMHGGEGNRLNGGFHAPWSFLAAWWVAGREILTILGDR